jgi:hypothetical protein
VRVFDGPVQQLPVESLAAATIVILATDNLTAEVEVGQRCIRLRLPLVQAAVHGETLVARISWWNNRDGSGACPACGFSTAEWNHLNRETVFTCAGVGNSERTTQTVATRSVAFLCSLAADLAMVQVLRFLLGLGKPVEDSVLEYCGYTHRSVLSPLQRNADCLCEHVAYERGTLPCPLDQATLAQLASAADREFPVDHASTSFEVGELLFVEAVLCCGRLQSVRRFGMAGKSVGQCSVCAQPMRADSHAFHSHRAVPAAMLEQLLNRRLGELGAGAARSVVLRRGDRYVLFIQGGSNDHSRSRG